LQLFKKYVTFIHFNLIQIVKNLSVILSSIACVGVAVLFFLNFSNNKPATAASNVAMDAVNAGALPVAYVNSDSLMTNYKLLDEMSKALEEKEGSATKQLQNRGAKLEEEMSSFQRRAQAGLLSNNEMKSGQEALLKKRDELMAYEDQLKMGLMEEKKLMNKRLYDSLMSYLKEYNKAGKFKYILNYTQGGTFFTADETLDITKDVVKGMNERYEANKNATKK
jgi:outer membrane protein